MKLKITMHTEKTVHKNIFSKNESKNLGVRMRRGECKTENKRAVGETLKAGKGRQRIRWGNVRSECNREKLWCSHVKHVTLIKKGRGWRLRVREWVVVGSNCKRLRKVPAFTLIQTIHMHPRVTEKQPKWRHYIQLCFTRTVCPLSSLAD